MIFDVTDQNFKTEVLDRSETIPVIVDFWASWCGPCKTLTPMLEKAVTEANGQVALGKVNTEQCQQVPAAFRVQSIPAVFGLFAGQMVDSFVGAQPETKVKEFVAGLVAAGSTQALDALVAAGDEASLRKALASKADYKPAVLALAQLLVDQGDGAAAVEALTAIEMDEESAPLFEAARNAALPVDSQSKIVSELTELLPLVKADDDARQRYLELLDELTVGSPSDANRWRQRLSTALF